MTEVKWGLLFIALFFVLVFGMEYRTALVRELSLTGIQYNLQLDTCLRDTLEQSDLIQSEGGFTFQNPQNVLQELKRELRFDFAVWEREGAKVQKEEEQRETALEQGIQMLILFEEDGFYYYCYGMEEVSEKQMFDSGEQAEKVSQLECFMERKIGENFQERGSSGSLRFTFPKAEKNKWAQTIQGTGLLLVYEAPIQFFQGAPYERFLLSGARAEGFTL